MKNQSSIKLSQSKRYQHRVIDLVKNSPRYVLSHACTKCSGNEWFRRSRKDRKIDHSYVCSFCNGAYGKKYEKEHPLRGRKKHWHAAGINHGEAQALLDAHDGRCDICETDKPGGRGGWHVDHDHETLRIRGILCRRCNIDLGFYERFKRLGLLGVIEEYLDFPKNHSDRD